MGGTVKFLKSIFYSKEYNDISALLNGLNFLIQVNVNNTDEITSDLLDEEILEEIKEIVCDGDIPIYFGKTLRDVKCIISDEDGLRNHDLFLKYIGPKKLKVSSVQLPHSALNNQEYSSVREVIGTFRKHIDHMKGYFHELEAIDRYCTVVEPVNPTFKEEFRKILLDDRTWLHIEVTPEGLATNIHLVGQSEHWQKKLQQGLLNWDHDVDIVENITAIFDIVNFPGLSCVKSITANPETFEKSPEASRCSICLCLELPDLLGLPQPLCQNPQCGVYFHRDCLFQWLVACAGGRPPAFGVATGSCPSCLQPIICNEKDV